MNSMVIKQAITYVNALEKVMFAQLEGKKTASLKTKAEIECCMLNAMAERAGEPKEKIKTLVDNIIKEKGALYAR